MDFVEGSSSSSSRGGKKTIMQSECKQKKNYTRVHKIRGREEPNQKVTTAAAELKKNIYKNNTHCVYETK
jgi:hypothetical protein